MPPLLSCLPRQCAPPGCVGIHAWHLLAEGAPACFARAWGGGRRGGATAADTHARSPACVFFFPFPPPRCLRRAREGLHLFSPRTSRLLGEVAAAEGGFGERRGGVGKRPEKGGRISASAPLPKRPPPPPREPRGLCLRRCGFQVWSEEERSKLKEQAALLGHPAR